jgi:hypothetical protein
MADSLDLLPHHLSSMRLSKFPVPFVLRQQALNYSFQNSCCELGLALGNVALGVVRVADREHRIVFAEWTGVLLRFKRWERVWWRGIHGASSDLQN